MSATTKTGSPLRIAWSRPGRVGEHGDGTGRGGLLAELGAVVPAARQRRVQVARLDGGRVVRDPDQPAIVMQIRGGLLASARAATAIRAGRQARRTSAPGLTRTKGRWHGQRLPNFRAP